MRSVTLASGVGDGVGVGSGVSVGSGVLVGAAVFVGADVDSSVGVDVGKTSTTEATGAGSAGKGESRRTAVLNAPIYSSQI